MIDDHRGGIVFILFKVVGDQQAVSEEANNVDAFFLIVNIQITNNVGSFDKMFKYPEGKEDHNHPYGASKAALASKQDQACNGYGREPEDPRGVQAASGVD
ncbi:hypothetical protein D3C72_1414150 [compost metagenome]